jgi:hypothetical protein
MPTAMTYCFLQLPLATAPAIAIAYCPCALRYADIFARLAGKYATGH